ncbi:MAG: prepilin-type N-terminal cleavage/methylation domain-containing protein [Sedimentisphaerales bacterium]|nr:prepilin-type N-terminal cleavage/methylation domain-containing protein [Sedimentisphaerales bacterium]
MKRTKCRSNAGATLIELIFSVVISLIVMLTAGTVVMSGNRAWQKSYDSATKQIKSDSLAASIAFGSMGRRANRLGYVVYEYDGEKLKPAKPKTTHPEEVVWGDAVEFRYWDVPLDSDDSHEVMDTTKIATAYALFYLDDDKLKVDYGPYPPGAAPKDGGPRNTSGVRTQVLAENVSVDGEYGAFSHTMLNGVGQGAVRINVVLTDPEDSEAIRVMTATLLRNMWPR